MESPVLHEGLEISPLDYLEYEIHENGNGNHQEFNSENFDKEIRPIVFDSVGLLNPAILLHYNGRCRCTELSSPRPQGSHKRERHHGYYPDDDYESSGTPMVFKKLRRSHYNQFLMLSCQEDLWHEKGPDRIPVEEINTYSANRYLEESGWLTDYAVTSYGLAKANALVLAADNGNSTKRDRSKLMARSEILTDLNDSAKEKVKDIVVMHREVLYCALTRYVRRTQEESMVDLLLESPAVDVPVLSPMIRREVFLEAVSNARLKEKAEKLGWGMRRLIFSDKQYDKMLRTRLDELYPGLFR